ncbi:hypothetical protein Ddc_17598 [Ditylenchus destructor]|nr:hypothetical protein Ddc_17598 [Ditylenchus destructor]
MLPHPTLLLLFLAGFSILSAEHEDHDNERPADKYSAKFNSETQEQVAEEEDLEAIKDEAAIHFAEKFYAIGQDALSSQDYKRALWCFNISYAYLPTNSKNLASRAKCYLKMQSYGEAFVDANEALDIDPQNESAKKTKALAMIGLERHLDAISRAVKNVKDPNFTSTYLDIIKEKKKGKSEQYLADIAEAALVEARKIHAEGNFRKAVEMYDDIIPNLRYGTLSYGEALTTRKLSLLLLERYIDAYVDIAEMMTIYGGFLSTHPQLHSFLHLKGRALFLMGRFELSDLERVFEFAPDYADSIADIPISELISKTRKKMNAFRNVILNANSWDILAVLAKSNEIVELMFGHPANQPRKSFSVKTADGTYYETLAFDAIVALFVTYHWKIPEVIFAGMSIDNDFITTLDKFAEKVLWTGAITIDACTFKMMTDDQSMHLFEKVIHPESLTLRNIHGLPSEVLNIAIEEHLFDSCTLAILGDEPTAFQLDSDVLVDYLHRPGNRQQANLTINHEFIEGGLRAFVMKIVKRFELDIDPAPFYLQLATDIKSPILADLQLENPTTQEILEQSILEEDSVKKTILRRYPIKQASLTHDAKIIEENPCTYAVQGQCKVRCTDNSSDIGAFLESYVQLANYMCQHIKVLLSKTRGVWARLGQRARESPHSPARLAPQPPLAAPIFGCAHIWLRDSRPSCANIRLRDSRGSLPQLRPDMSNDVSCIASVRNEAADIKDCAGPYRTITKTLFTPFYLPSEQWCREVQSFRKCARPAIEQPCGDAAALYHDIGIAAQINGKIAQHLIDGSLKSWNPTGSGECELALKPPLLESTTTRAVTEQSAAVPTIIEQSTVQTNATEPMPSVNSTVENPDEDKPEDSTDDKDDTANSNALKVILVSVTNRWNSYFLKSE